MSQGLVLDLGPGLVFDFGPGLYPLTPAPAFGEIKINFLIKVRLDLWYKLTRRATVSVTIFLLFQLKSGYKKVAHGKKILKIEFSNYFLSFLNPKKLFYFEISLSIRSVALGKIGKNIFPGWKKNCSTWKNIFPSWKFFFPIFPHEKIGKVKKIFCYHNCPDLSLFE